MTIKIKQTIVTAAGNQYAQQVEEDQKSITKYNNKKV